MAAIWKGAISFGLVNIPVQLEPAVKAEETISFRQLDKKHHAPIKYERVSSKTGEPVAWDDIVKGYEYEKGRFVVVTPEEIKKARLESSSTIDILDFVSAEEIDPRYFEKPYFIVPAKGGAKPYALLREAIRDSGMVGIGKFVMRQKQYLVGIKVVGDALVLETMRFAEELVDTEDLSLPEAGEVRPQELQMAKQLVQNLAEPFDPKKYTDEHHERLMALIEAKMKGRKIAVVEEDAPEATKVVDLMERLQASLAEAKKGSAHTSGHAKAKKTRTRTTKRRKSA